MVPAVRMTIMIREVCLERDNYVLPFFFTTLGSGELHAY